MLQLIKDCDDLSKKYNFSFYHVMARGFVETGIFKRDGDCFRFTELGLTGFKLYCKETDGNKTGVINE